MAPIVAGPQSSPRQIPPVLWRSPITPHRIRVPLDKLFYARFSFGLPPPLPFPLSVEPRCATVLRSSSSKFCRLLLFRRSRVVPPLSAIEERFRNSELFGTPFFLPSMTSPDPSRFFLSPSETLGAYLALEPLPDRHPFENRGANCF